MTLFPSIIVISSCTGAKVHKPANQLLMEDFRLGGEHLKQREQELAAFRMSAKRLYTGMQHQQVSQAFDLLAKRKDVISNLQIISAGYGLIDQYQFIAPYETTFNDLGSREVVKWSRQLGIHEALNAKIKAYDIVVFLLGEHYLKSAALPLESRPEQSFIFLASGGSAAVLPQHDARQAVMTLVNKDAQRFGYGMVGLKGFLFLQLARAIVQDPAVLHAWHQHPQSAIDALERWQQVRDERRHRPVLLEGFTAPPGAAEPAGAAATISVHRSGMNFNPDALSAEAFYPQPQHALPQVPRSRFTVVINNRDKLKLTKGLAAPKMERLWHFIEGTPRGYLTSLAYHSPSSDPLPKTQEGNIYDCGAWSYKTEAQPILKKKDGPLTPESTMQLFTQAGARPGVDLIVSPDMMILNADTPDAAREKIETSLRFAREMRPLAVGHRLMAVTHGTFEQRHEMMEGYLEMGYRHIALGGLAMKSSRDPYFVYRCVEDALQYRQQVPDLYIHVLGVSSITWAGTLTHLGVDSFDGSSMYMQAFTAGAFMRYVPNSEQLLYKYRIVENAPWSDELPPCDCPACEAMRGEGWDTRAQGGKPTDPTGRPYNGGNEANMGRAVHNINMYLRALQDVQARILTGDESLLVKRDRYRAARQKREAPVEQDLLLGVSL